MAIADRVAAMTTDQLISIANGKHENGYGIASDAAIKVASEELKRRGASGGNAPEAPIVADPISADAYFISNNASRDAGRIIKHLWIIFVLLPVVLGILFVILTAK